MQNTYLCVILHELSTENYQFISVLTQERILSKVSCFLLKSFHFVGYRNDRFVFPYKSLYFECYATMPMLADAHILCLGYLRTEWSPIRPVIIRVMTKSDDRVAGVRFV